MYCTVFTSWYYTTYIHAHFMEHKRAANNPPSDPENSIGQHYFGKNYLVAFALVYATHTKTFQSCWRQRFTFYI